MDVISLAPPSTIRMAQLADLPVEVVTRIITHALPEGFESLALSCKDIYRLCTPYIARHNLLRKQFDWVAYCPNPSAVRNDPLWRPLHNAFGLLERIADEPNVACYIRQAEFTWDSFKPGITMPPNVPDIDDGGPVLELLADSAFLRRAGLDYRDFYSRIAQDLPWFWEPAEVSDKLLNIIAADARHPLRSPASLANLTRLDVDMHPPRELIKGVDFVKLWPLLTLPEMRTFRVERLVASGLPGRQVPPGLGERLQHAYMLYSYVDQSIMAQLLRASVQLETLAYSHCALPDDTMSVPWDFGSFLHMLECETGSHLQRLYVEGHCPLAPDAFSIRRFRQLRKLILPLEFFKCSMSYAAQKMGKSLAGLTKNDIHKLGLQLGNFIPASVTEVTLLSPGHDSHVKVLEVLFYEFAALRATLLPALKRIVLECVIYESSGPEAAYMA
ncbi:hypothetical protein B0I35DRAFT_465302 [Stachybotrys elegans]|uniref:F-box domain-containing protein n=1 Tax=Stachybotrys elegans TaxID=80388 RepID=A0A8K0SEM8_9HYPO|nr:hypothetical protein B0I35DRAFT_465302 [Stachybotrys elegans]